MAAQNKQAFRRALEVLTEGAAAPGVSSIRLEALGMHEEARPWTLAENIQGLGIAERITDGRRLDELALKVYVERKLPKSRLANPVPGSVPVPGLGGAVETDVQEIGKVELEATTSRFRPAMPGCGVGHLEVEVGTFGCLVRKRDDPDGDLYVLSNSHVLANEGLCQVGDVIIQAGRYDGGIDPDDILCELVEWVPFEFSESGYPNLVDAAIARVKNTAEVTSAVHLIGVPNGHSTYVRRGMQVKKSGRTTDFTLGEITDTDYRLQLWYKKPDGSGKARAGLADQVLCTRYTAPGDSGAAVFNTSDNVVGLHFAGSSSTSIFNRIGHVFDALGLELVTTEIPPPGE